jgi:hypothetical protein
MTHGLNEKGEVVGEPSILFIDEAAAMPTEVGIGLNRVMETTNNVRIMTIAEDNNREVKSHPGWRCVFAGNTNGAGANDMQSQSYTAQQCSLDASLLQRMTATFRFGYDRSAEEMIVRRACNDDSLVKTFLTFKAGVRDALKRHELNTSFSTKRVIDIWDLYPTFMKAFSGSKTPSKLMLGKAIYYAGFELLTDEEKKKYDELWYPLTSDKISRWSPLTDPSQNCDYL